MRKLNVVVSVALLVIFLIHGIMGSFQLLGVSASAGKTLAWIGAGLIVVHTVLSAVLTVRTIRSGKGSGKWYMKQNSLFWTRRISGVVLLVMAFSHVGLFGQMVGDEYILSEFTAGKMIIQILLIASLFIHIFVNVRPMLVSLGVLKYKERRIDLFLILSVLLLFFTVAVIIYFIGWQL